MGKNPKAATMRKYDTIPLAPGTRRELSVRRILDKYGDPLEVLAKRMADGDDAAAKALLPYCYPALKAVELTGAEGGALQVQVLKLSGKLGETGNIPATPSTQTVDITKK